ncbi:MAG: Membrane-bound dehydrogenase domain protein [Verrucomicrobiales bacterium]|nr:Membrane-bound dehydrogenase domain protein [Verrucomicrobiales bacterium]
MKLALKLFPLLLVAVTLSAQIGDKSDKAGDPQKPIVPRELIPPSPLLTPEEALKAFKVAPGMKVECVASEPLVEDPVSARFDQDGRLWVVEMCNYMPDSDGKGEDEATGRVVILRDTDGDGKFDKRTVFAEKLLMPRAVMPVAGGALIGAPPNLWFCRDTNGDDVMDEKVVVATDYGVAVDPKRPELANPERAPNAPTWNLDNWIYSASYMTKFRYVNGEWKKGLTIFRGQYGLSQDDDGHLFYNSNSDQLRCDVIPSHYLGRNANYQGAAGNNVNAAENQLVWPARVNPGINRGYKPEILRDYKLKAFTAANSPFIFYSDLFPKEFYGNAFVAEPAGNLVHRSILIETNGTLLAKNAYDQAEFLASTDERFRPVNFCTGPDGALYVVDFHRGNIEHRISLTSYLRKQIDDRGLEKPIHLGRIFRVVPEGKTASGTAQFSKEPPSQWVNRLSHPNSWWRFTAQRCLVEKRDMSVVPALKNLALSGAGAQGRIHSLWTLEGLAALDLSTTLGALKDKDARVRANAIRLSERFFDGEDKGDVIPKLLKLTDDFAPQVQLQLALTLGEARERNTDLALLNLAKLSVPNIFLPDAILSGLNGRETAMLEAIAGDKTWSDVGTNAQRVIRGLARCVMTSRNADNVRKVLDLIAADKSSAQQIRLLDGLIAGGVKKPVKFKTEPSALAALEKSTNTEIKKRVTKLNTFLTWPGKPGAAPEPVIAALTTAQQTRFDMGKRLFEGSCAACHQLHGLGMDGLAPPLVDSEWVLGSEQRITRIVLHGLTGPLKVNGRSYHLDMPSMGIFDDEQIASILTYVRREWENTGAPVEPTTVKQIRADTAKRQEAWSQAELLNVP